MNFFLSKLKKHDVHGEKLCEIEAAAKGTQKSYSRRRDMGIEKATKYHQNIEQVAVPFDTGLRFCVLKKHTYEAKLTLMQGSEQFERHDNMNDSVVEKIEKKS